MFVYNGGATGGVRGEQLSRIIDVFLKYKELSAFIGASKRDRSRLRVDFVFFFAVHFLADTNGSLS